ncbi:CbbX protein [uncultured Eubacterium sp.]|nr:CbbX protein [uncultured Eubacterium sp.]
MDKYEYRVKTEQMLEHMERKRYKKAMEIADTIDWRRVKNPAMLNSVSEIYEFNGEYQKSRDVLFVAYDRAPNSRKTIYRLGTLALRLNDVDEASDCYEEFVKLAPKDPNQYILKYKILKARRAPLSEQIDALEEFKKAEYIEKWAYELACLYDQTGMTAECLEECDDLILWFSEGKYVYKAMELKMKYKPLTPLQQEKYNSQKKAYEHPLVESEEAEEQQEEEAKAVEEAPENAVAESPEKDTDKGEDKGAETSILREEPKEVSTEDIAAKALAAVAETEEVPLTAEKKEAEESEEPAEKPHKRSGLRQSVKGATLAEALKKGMAVANGENPESKALNKSDEDLRVTGQMKIDDILQAWEAKQKDNAEAIEIQKKKDEEILAQKKLEAEKRREEEARRIEEQQRAAEEARRIAEQKAAEEARRAAARRAEEERLLAEQRAEEERRRAIEEAEAEERRLEQEAAEKAKAEAEARRKQEEEETQEIEDALEEVEADEDEFEEAELEEVEADEDEFEEVMPEEPEADEDEFEEAEFEEDEFEEAEYEEVPDKTDDLADLLRELEETDAEKENDAQGFFDDEFEEDDVNDDFLDDDLDAEYDEYEEEPKGEEAYDDAEFEEDEFEEGDFEDEFEEEEPEPDLSSIDDLTIEEPSEEEIQRRIKKGRGGVPFDTGFVVTGRYDLSATSEIGLRAGLTEEQKQLFSYFVPVRGMSEQIVEVLDNDRRERREGTSRTGNIVVIGHKGSGKTVLAVDIVKAIQKQRNLKQGKVAIVTGESLNKKELGGIIQKLRGGAIIIEKAGQLNTRTVRDLNRLMEKKTGELLVVLEDQRKPLEKLFTANPSFKKKFTSKLELPVFINDELVTFGQTYAKENGYKLDEMGILALYSRIDVMQREDHAVTVAEIKEIMDDAIDHSQKANVKHFARRVFGKGTDDRDRIILKEDDFRI